LRDRAHQPFAKSQECVSLIGDEVVPMDMIKLAAAMVATAMLSGPVAAANEACAPMNHVVTTARNDFPALRSLKMKPGICTFRSSEYKCRWAFPGDAFGPAEGQFESMVQCAAATTAEAPRKSKRGQTLVSLEPDLWLVLAKPEIDSGQWVIVMRIIAGPAPAG